MERQLRKGNIVEALFRLWTDDKRELLDKLEFRQLGYNPAGIITVDQKRDLLKVASDPDFAVVRAGSHPPRVLAGISINGQKRGYTAASTMGGLCIRCPRSISCLDRGEANLWYNRYNITNDYAQFRRRFPDVDVVLVSLLVASLDEIHKQAKKRSWHDLVFRLIGDGPAAVAAEPEGEEMIRYLRYGARGKVARSMTVLHLLHSELEIGTVPHFVTGGLSQFGHPRPVCCVDIKLAHDEQSLIDYLGRL